MRPDSGPPSRRRPKLSWIVLVAGLMLTVGAVAHIRQQPGGYSSEVRVLFLAPTSAANPNALAISSSSVITTAGLVARIVDPHTHQTVSNDVTLAAEGVQHGFAVRLPDSGGQWATNFDRPELDVQAVGSAPKEVVDTMTRVVQRIADTLRQLQVSKGVAPNNMITVSQTPPTVPVYYQDGSPARALAATVLLGVGLSTTLTAIARRAERRRRPTSGS